MKIFKDVFNVASSITSLHESYKYEFEEDIINTLLTFLQTLYEERVVQNLRDINSRENLTRLYAKEDFENIASVFLEVLMFFDFLDDKAIENGFFPFLIEVENSCDLNITQRQQYRMVYSLMFLQKTKD